MTEEQKGKVTRRNYLKYAGGVVAAAVVAAAGYGIYESTKPPPVTPPLTQTATETVTSVVTASPTPTTTAPSFVIQNITKYKKAPTPTTLDFYTDKGPFGTNWAKLTQMGSPSFSDYTNLSINPVNFSTTDVFQAAFYQVAPTKNCPALYNWWTGFQLRTIAKRGYAADLGSVWDAHKDDVAPALRGPYTVDGVARGIPFALNYWIMYYNPKIWQKQGYKVPTSWDDLLSLAKNMKEAGITWPIYCPFVEWTGFIWLEELLVGTDPDFYDSLMIGKAKYTDPQAINALKIFSDMVKSGCFGDIPAGAASGHTLYPPPPDLIKWWTDGKIGMVLVGDWLGSPFKQGGLKPGEDYDLFLCPNENKDLGNIMIVEPAPICVGQNSANKDWGLEYMDFFMSAEAQTYWQTQIWPGVFWHNKVPSSLADPVQAKLSAMIAQGQWRLITRIWEATPPPIIINASTLMDKLAYNPDQVDSVAKDMEAAAETYWTQNPQ